MKLTFNNIENPSRILDELIIGGINASSIRVENNLLENETIAKNVWIYCNDEDVNKINEIVAEHNPIQEQQPTQDEILRAKLIKDNATILLQLTAQQKLNADLLLKIAKIGGATNV